MTNESEQLVNRLTVVLDNEVRSALIIEVRRIQRDIKVTVNRRRDVSGSHGPFLDRAAVGFGRSDHLAVPQAAPGKCHRHHLRPMVASVRAALSPNLRRAAEFPHGNDQNVIQQAPFFQIAHQG